MDSNFKENNRELYYLLGAAIILIILAGIVLHFYGLDKEEEFFNKKVERNIYSLKSNSQISGRFVLGTGKIQEQDYYFFFSKDKNFGGFVKEKILAEETLLVEKDTVPFIVENLLVKKEIRKRIFNSDVITYDTLSYGFLYEVPSSIKYKYILTIPKGTITENQVFQPL